MSHYRDQLERWISQLSIKADYVLDIGGSQKPMTKRKLQQWEVKEYLILDNKTYPTGEGQEPNIFADVNYPFEFYTNSRVVEMVKMNGQPYEKFDVVLCFEVGEYIWNPVQWHLNMNGLLKKDGIAYISYPSIYPLHNPPGIDYLRYTKNAIEKLLTESGFKTWEITPRVSTAGMKHLHDFYTSEKMRPMKNTDEIYDIGYMVKAFN